MVAVNVNTILPFGLCQLAPCFLTYRWFLEWNLEENVLDDVMK